MEHLFKVFFASVCVNFFLRILSEALYCKYIYLLDNSFAAKHNSARSCERTFFLYLIMEKLSTQFSESFSDFLDAGAVRIFVSS